ncbi:purine-nucleoside phosphorylase [Trueperella sp. LYQ143]|uniref:purine-nucleoside phosphorylase n=1 Tax=unclassified Trueperella TaxID=2630174 RepID=UPI0039836735
MDGKEEPTMSVARCADDVVTQDSREGGAWLREQAGGPLDVLVVLGSGLADTLGRAWGEPTKTLALSDIPTVYAPVADGHADEFRIYRDAGGTGLCVGVALGRTHVYEGHGVDAVTALAKVAYAAGIRAAILCNANGCLRDWELGDVVAVNDHVNLAGVSPFDGPVFVDISGVWDSALTAELAQVCQRQGSYGFLRGPEYQTRLETQILAHMGIDCVGMSTIMEAIMLHALNVRVCGMSVVSDLSFADAPTDPAEVVAAAQRAHGTVRAGIERVLQVLAGEGSDGE